MGFTTTFQDQFLDEYFAVERFLSLHSAPPGAGGSYASEVPAGGTGYIRQSLAGKLSVAAGGLITNVSAINFPLITGNYPVVTDFGVGSALTGGIMGVTGVFNESSLRSIGQSYQFAPGALRFQLR